MTRIIMAKPIRALEFHYPIIQFLIHGNSCGHTTDFYLGQIHQKSPKVNSSRVLFYLSEKFWEGHTTDNGPQGFHAS